MKQTHYPLVSIVLLNWNGLQHTKVCLEHARKLDYPNYELIVVDNGSRQQEKDYLRKQPDIIFVDNPTNRGFTGGHIDGLAECSGEFIVLLNNDAVMKSDYIKQALAYFTDERVAAVGGRSYFWNEQEGHDLLDPTNPFYAYQNIDIHTGEAFMQSTDFGVAQEVNNLSGSCVMVRKSVIDSVGYLYDRFFCYFEETDLFARYKRAGYKTIYSPALQIWHRNGASSGASSGSTFFFYQIFRNRFIFAYRNFESAALPRFTYRYARSWAGSLARLILKRGDRVMHKAYVRAGLYVIGRLPIILGSRFALRRKLGKSQYNHQIYSEQTGTSFVIDCAKLSKKELEQAAARAGSDTNPLHEYLLVTPLPMPVNFLPEAPNVRYVVDKQYFQTTPLNLGCLAARFDWMTVGTASAWPNVTDVNAAVKQTVGSNKTIIGLGSKLGFAPALIMHKAFFQHVGGLKQGASFGAMVRYHLTYGALAKRIMWVRGDTPSTHKLTLETNKKAIKAVRTTIAGDKTLAASNHTTLYGRLKKKYYRVYQASTFVHWLFMPQISLYLKGARLKNLVLFTLTLRQKSLALEFKHIRNEVILNRGNGINVAAQQATTKKRLKVLLENPKDLPVFVICRDRFDCLEVQLEWLKRQGLHKIVLIDNDSVYPPLAQYFNQTPCQVLKLYRNVGHTSPWALSIVRALVPEDFYIVTDPDIIPAAECPKDVLKHFLQLHQQFFMYLKVGFGLRIDDLPNHYPLKKAVIEWEQQFWQHKLDDGAFEAGIDTTFAVYKPFSYFYRLHPCIRTDFPYVASHLPWYTNPKTITKEETHYRFRLDHNVSSWNTDDLKDRYAKELGKKKR